MGYYSEVSISLYKRDFVKLVQKFVTEEGLDEYEREFIRNARVSLFKQEDNSDRDIIVVHWDYVKWYDSFAEIRLIEDFLDDCGGAYKFIRIGEDEEDIEIRKGYVDNDDDAYEVYSKISVSSWINTDEDVHEETVDDVNLLIS